MSSEGHKSIRAAWLVVAAGVIAGGSVLVATRGESRTASVGVEERQSVSGERTSFDPSYRVAMEIAQEPISQAPDTQILQTPLAMLEPDESIPITSELQAAEWEQLQEEFVQAVGGRAPSNEAEKEVWIRAQQENDDLFRAKFGWDAFRQQQLKAYMEGLAPAPAP